MRGTDNTQSDDSTTVPTKHPHNDVNENVIVYNTTGSSQNKYSQTDHFTHTTTPSVVLSQNNIATSVQNNCVVSDPVLNVQNPGSITTSNTHDQKTLKRTSAEMSSDNSIANELSTPSETLGEQRFILFSNDVICDPYHTHQTTSKKNKFTRLLDHKTTHEQTSPVEFLGEHSSITFQNDVIFEANEYHQTEPNSQTIIHPVHEPRTRDNSFNNMTNAQLSSSPCNENTHHRSAINFFQESQSCSATSASDASDAAWQSELSHDQLSEFTFNVEEEHTAGQDFTGSKSIGNNIKTHVCPIYTSTPKRAKMTLYRKGREDMSAINDIEGSGGNLDSQITESIMEHDTGYASECPTVHCDSIHVYDR